MPQLEQRRYNRPQPIPQGAYEREQNRLQRRPCVQHGVDDPLHSRGQLATRRGQEVAHYAPQALGGVRQSPGLLHSGLLNGSALGQDGV